MQETTGGIRRTPSLRRAGLALQRAARHPWTWVAAAYLALALTVAFNAPSFSRFIGSLVWTTLALSLVAWTVVVWRILFVSTRGSD